MKSYEIKKIIPDGIKWDEIPTLTLDTRYEDTPECARVSAQICYSDEAFFVHFISEEAVIRSEEIPPHGVPCHDSCLEFFFSPINGDKRYINVEFNSNKCLFLGLGADGLTRLGVEDESVFNPEVKFFDGGWEIFYTVPFVVVKRIFKEFEPRAGYSMRANCYKCADMKEPPEFLSWSPVTTVPLCFHAPDDFGIMTFAE